MSRREHTSRHYELQLRELKDRLLVMSDKAEKAIRDSMEALVNRSPSLAREVIERDDEVDRLELEIDDLCLRTLALEQPVASDLRLLATVLKVVRDLERIGDIGANASKRVLELVSESELKPLVDLPIMMKEATQLLRSSVDAFVNGDVELAEKVIRGDDRLDFMHEQIFRELLTYMLEDPSTISRCIKLMFIAKGLERVGDHAANIAEMVVFLVRGKDIRHGMSADGKSTDS
jgi:phosphate transport system protein